MPASSTLRIALAAAGLAALAAAAILLNLALLGYAQPRNDPVGKLSPRAALAPPPATSTATSTAVAPPARPREHSGEPDD
jgi:hypothetical protein